MKRAIHNFPLLYSNGGELLLLTCRAGFRIIQMETLSNLNWPFCAVTPAKIGIHEIDGFSGFPFLRL